MTFRSIDGPGEIDRLVSASENREASADWVRGLLERGESRPPWCRLALAEDGAVLAAHALDSWSPDGPPGDIPTYVHLLGHTDEAAAVALLDHDLPAFGVGRVEVRLVSAADAAEPLRALRASQQRVLAAAGFTLEVDRVRLEWSGPVRPQSPPALTFRPASTLAPAELVEVFAAVGDGSVDHGMVTDRAEVGRRAEAALRLGRAQRREYDDDWFVVGVDGAGDPVGYVQAAAIGTDGRAMLAEIGVVEARRGRRHVDDLLAYGTGVLVGRGRRQIRAYTDTANRGMRAAFARGGYAETGARRDFLRSKSD